MSTFEHGYALVVGVSGYPRLPASLRLPPSVSNDAVQIARVLWDQEQCAYPASRVKLLRDEQATADEIRAGLYWLASETGTEDTAVLYFSGHGWHLKTDSEAESCLAGYDARDDPRGHGLIRGDELTELLDDIPAGRLVVFLDCCYAGAIGEVRVAEESPEPIQGGLEENYYDQLSRGAGRVIIAASMAQDVAYAPEDLPNSLFTHHLLAALHGDAAVRPDGLITVFDVFDCISNKMAQGPQRPIFKSVLNSNFPIALHRGGRRSPHTEPDGHEEQRFLCLDLLRNLLDAEFDRVLQRLDPQGKSQPKAPPPDETIARRLHAENLMHLMNQRGAHWWSQLQETALAAASPFSPIDRWLSEWDLQPPRSWQKQDLQFIGLGEDPPLFPDASPEELQHGSVLTWRGPNFRDATVDIDLWLPTLDQHGVAGLVLRYVAGHSAVLGLLRHDPLKGAAVELWQQDGVGLRCLGTTPLAANGGEDGWYRLHLGVWGPRARVRIGDLQVEEHLHADLPAGDLALVKFADSVVRFRNLHLEVQTRE